MDGGTGSEGLRASAERLAGMARERALEIEEARRVPADLSAELGRARLYRMLVPRALGGLEVSPLALSETLETLATGDGATAWVVMTGSTTGLLLAYLDESIAKSILEDAPDAALAGVFAPMGKAVPSDGGYRLSGRWPWGSGCENAEWRMAGALIPTEKGPRMLEGGGPEIRSCFFRASESKVIDTWRVRRAQGHRQPRPRGGGPLHPGSPERLRARDRPSP